MTTGRGRLITEEIPARVGQDSKFQNARQNSDEANARIEHDRALGRVMTAIMEDDMQLFRLLADDRSFGQRLEGRLFGLNYPAIGYGTQGP